MHQVEGTGSTEFPRARSEEEARRLEEAPKGRGLGEEVRDERGAGL